MKTVTVTVPHKWTAEVRGDTRAVMGLLRRADVPKLYDYRSNGGPCWTCPALRVPDLMAAATLMKNVSLIFEHEQATLL